MREPVRSAPPPPRGRPASKVHHTTADTMVKRPVLTSVGGPTSVPARPSRAPTSRAPPAPKPAAPHRQGVRLPPKKKPPPRPPPPKFQDWLPPTYEQVLQEDAAVLAGFGFSGGSGGGSGAPAHGADLIDFNTPAPAPAVPLTWDTPPAVSAPARADFQRRAEPTSAPTSAPTAARAEAATAAVTVIRPAKPAGAVSRGPPPLRLSTGGQRAAEPTGAAAEPPMPSMPPPPPPVLEPLEGQPTVRPPTPPPRPGSSASSSADAPRATAVYDFQTGEPGDLNFEAGELIYLLERVDQDWLRGRCGCRRGMFPAAFVEVIVPLAGEVADDPTESGWPATALYDFAPHEPQDLALTAGEQVLVLGRVNDEWGYGTAHTQTGQFPLTFVDVETSRLPFL